MRILAPLLAGAALLFLTWCSTRPESAPSVTRPTVTATPAATGLVEIDPRALVLPTEKMIPGTFTMTEGSLASAQWNRNWDREPTDPNFASSAARIGINARLYLSIEDAVADFNGSSVGANAQESIVSAIALRGFDRQNIRATAIEWPALGTDAQSAFRVEFTRGSAVDTWVEYWIYMQESNTRALIKTVAQNIAGAEASNLREETREIAKRQADHLLTISAQAQRR